MVVSPFYPDDIPVVPLHHALFMKMQEFGDNIAIVDGFTDESYSFNQLLGLSKKLASALYKLGVRKGDVVAVFTRNNINYGIILYAIMSAGAIATTANPTYTKYELTYHLKDSTAKFVFTDEENANLVKEVANELQTVKGIICDNGGAGTISLSSLLKDDASAWPELLKIPFNPKEDVALLPYSSGTTGLPKGVMLTHSNLVSNMLQVGHPQMPATDVDPDEPVIIMALLPFYHVYGLVGCLFMGMSAGRKLICMPKFKPKLFLAAIQKYQVTYLPLVPPLIIFLTKSELIKDYDLSSVKTIGSGAAPLSIESENEFRGKVPQVQTLRQGFGMTETTMVAMSHSGQRDSKPGSVGNLLSRTEGKVVDVNTGKSLGPLQRGELMLRGPQIMKGYWNKPEATANTIDEFGFLHTGDIAYYDTDGAFFIVDRIKELIKTKGLQVAPAELEAVLLTHPSVADVGVTGIPHPTAGEVPRAYVVIKQGHNATADQIKQFVADTVSAHKRLEGGVIFVNEVPKSPSGKILRRKLKEIAVSSKL